MVARYPLHCMKMADFLALDTLEPHNKLLEQGKVVPMDLEGAHAGVEIQFVSHQWLGYEVADPKREHLRTMQAAFKRAMTDGSKFFKTEDDWKVRVQSIAVSPCLGLALASSPSLSCCARRASQAFATGMSSANRESLKGAKDALDVDDDTLKAIEGSGGNSGEGMDLEAASAAFQASVRDGWVWMDYISVPQTIGLSDPAAVRAALAKQALAIRSIPAYITRAHRFWICTPYGATHESGQRCSYATWNERGWCRLEETTISLLNLANHARPLLLTDDLSAYLNGTGSAVTPDSVDRVSVHIQRRNSVLNGAFSCCSLGHRVKTLDGSTADIPCDKVILRQVLAAVFDEGLARAKAVWSADPLHDKRDMGTGTFWGAMGHGFMGGDLSFVRWYFNKSLRQCVFAESDDEPDFVKLGWCKPCEQLTSEDAAAYCARWGMAWAPDGSVERAAGAFWPAQEGNLPMLRYMVEALHVDFMAPNPLGVTALHCAARQGFDAIVQYLVSKATERVGGAGDELNAWLDLKTAGPNYLSPIDGAAVRGHHSTIRLLASLGASVHTRRANGRTPLHSAAAFGHAECIRALLELGADPEAVADDGSKPADLVTNSCSLWAWPTADHDRCLELLASDVERESKDK